VLITRPEESYHVSKCMCDHRNPERGPMFQVEKDRKMMMISVNTLYKDDYVSSFILFRIHSCNVIYKDAVKYFKQVCFIKDVLCFISSSIQPHI
jgi:hypothetical protein